MKFELAKSGYMLMIFKKMLIGTILLTAVFSCGRKQKKNVNNTAKADGIMQKTDDLLNAGQIDKAHSYLDSAYRAFPDAGLIDKWKRYSCLRNFYLNYKVNPIKADLYTDSMFLILNGFEEQYKNEYAQSIFARGDVLRAEEKFNEAFYKYYEGRKFALKNLDSCELSGFTNRLGLIRYAQQDFLKAVNYFKQALKENAKCSGLNTFEITFIAPQSIYNSMAFSYEQAGKADSALFYYQKGLDFIEKERSKYPDRKVYIESAIGVFSGNIGGLYAMLDKYADAEKYLKQSIALNDREGYAREDAGTAKNKLASMYIEQGRIAEAGQLIEDIGCNFAKREGNNYEKQIMQLTIDKLKSDYYEKKGDYKQAFTYLVEWNTLKTSIAKVIKKLKGIDMDAAFKEAEQAHQLELTKKNVEIRTFYLVATILISLLAIGILLMVWFNLKRTRSHLRQLNDTLRILEQSQEENKRMVRIVAHDLRNPIGAVYMCCSLMKQKNKFDPDLLGMIQKSASDSLVLVDNLLRTRETAEVLEKQPEDIYGILRFCINQLSNKAQEKGQKIELEGSEVQVPVNAEQIWRVITNLISNSIKFSPNDTTIMVKLTKKSSSVLIAVEDRGIGIPKELQSKIFTHPDETKRMGTAGEETFGLGLVISRQIVLAHNGKIWFNSADGSGTTFYVELPL